MSSKLIGLGIVVEGYTSTCSGDGFCSSEAEKELSLTTGQNCKKM